MLYFHVNQKARVSTKFSKANPTLFLFHCSYIACFQMNLEEVISLKILATDFAIMSLGCQIGFWATFFNNHILAIVAFNFQICEDKTIFINTNGFKSVICYKVTFNNYEYKMREGGQKTSVFVYAGGGGALCVEMGFTWTFPRNQDATVKSKSELISIIF